MMNNIKTNAPKNGKKAIVGTIGTLLGIIAWIGVWQIASVCVGIEMILPSPYSVFRTFSKLVFTKSFWETSAFTLFRIVSGFLIGTLLGVTTAIVCHFVYPLKVFFSPAVKIVRSTPVSSFILIAILWMPSGAVPIFIALLMVFPIIYGNFISGLENTDKFLTEAAGMYSFSFPKKMLLLYLPSALPYLGSACTTSLGLAFKAGVAAEVLCVTKNSIGKNLYTSNIYFETDELFAWTLTVILLSVLIEQLIKLSSYGIKKLAGRRYVGYNSK